MGRHELEQDVIGVRARGLICAAALAAAAVPVSGCQAILGIKDPAVAGVGPDGTAGGDASSADAAGVADGAIGGADGAIGTADGGAKNPDAPRDGGGYGIPAARTRTVMVYDAGRDRLVLFGGDHFGQRLGDTWEWDGVGWTDVTPSSGSPPPRSDAMMTYDPTVGKVVLVGGVNSVDQIFGDVWEWDGTSWLNETPTSNPKARLSAGLAFDAGCNCALLFGGANTTYLGDTFKWDGTTRSWSPLNTPISPSARDAFSMAYDANDQAVLLFGGQNGTDLGDTWEWNVGTGWTQQQPATSPVPGPHYPMAYDAKRGRAVLFGAGMSGANIESNHTWEWDGSTWTDVTPASGSPPAGEYAMAYDASLARVIMYAGGPDMYAWDGTSWSTL